MDELATYMRGWRGYFSFCQTPAVLIALTRCASGHCRRSDPMKRREFIAGLGSAAAWPVVARAQQATMPVIGYLSVASAGPIAPSAFLEGLAETGFIVGRNAKIEYRWAADASQMPAMAADIVRLQPAVIVALLSSAAIAVKAATSTIPIVFGTGDDPVKLGLVSSLNHPGGNVTGATNLNVETEGKRLAMMHAIVPVEKTIAALVDPSNPAAKRQESALLEAERGLGRKVRVLRAAKERVIDGAFKTLVQENLGALFVTADVYFGTRRHQIVTLAAYHAIPAFYSRREFAETVGLLSYGTDASSLSDLADHMTYRV
jgi:putative ABC transport system substrate-binding protein